MATDNCNYDVHVGNYESSNGSHISTRPRAAGDIDVHLTVTGESTRPLILVLTSYEPVKWRLNVTSGVIIERVILVRFSCSIFQLGILVVSPSVETCIAIWTNTYILYTHLFHRGNYKYTHGFIGEIVL